MASQEKFNPTATAKREQPIPASEKPTGNFKDADMQSVIGWILRVGVIVSMAVVVLGGIIFLWRHGHSIPDFHTFKKIPYFISSSEGVFEGVIHGKGQAIVQLGIMILIATPVMRVVFAVIAFALEKDRLYMLISLLVLLIILASMLTGRIA
jgi:uncharacterized membrane protein